MLSTEQSKAFISVPIDNGCVPLHVRTPCSLYTFTPPPPHPLSFYLASSILSKKLICSIYESRSRSSRRETKLIYQVMQSPYYAPAHVDSSRPSLSFPLGTALLLIVIFSLSGIFSCCYHWDKLRSLRRSFNTDHEDDTDDAPSKPKHTQKVLFPPLLSF